MRKYSHFNHHLGDVQVVVEIKKEYLGTHNNVLKRVDQNQNQLLFAKFVEPKQRNLAPVSLWCCYCTAKTKTE